MLFFALSLWLQSDLKLFFVARIDFYNWGEIWKFLVAPITGLQLSRCSYNNVLRWDRDRNRKKRYIDKKKKRKREKKN